MQARPPNPSFTRIPFGEGEENTAEPDPFDEEPGARQRTHLENASRRQAVPVSLPLRRDRPWTHPSGCLRGCQPVHWKGRSRLSLWTCQKAVGVSGGGDPDHLSVAHRVRLGVVSELRTNSQKPIFKPCLPTKSAALGGGSDACGEVLSLKTLVLRFLLGPTSGPPPCVLRVPKTGYRFRD